MNLENLDFKKGDGLIPAIVQDADTYRVLMLGYMNREALETTLSENRITFYSRSKERLWTKGETSDNYLDLVDWQSDCDNDTLLFLAHPQGPTCHTGEPSCFFEKEFMSDSEQLRFLSRLQQVIQQRKRELPDGSYTTKLFRTGIDLMAQKVGEEAVETIIEAKNDDSDTFIDETADLLYHLIVLLVGKDLSLEDIVERLEERHEVG